MTDLNKTKEMPLQRSTKSALTTLLLCMFLGNFGAHNFYLNKPKAALKFLILWCLLIFLRVTHPANEMVADADLYGRLAAAVAVMLIYLLFFIFVFVDLTKIVFNKCEDSEGRLLVLLNPFMIHWNQATKFLLLVSALLNIVILMCIHNNLFPPNINCGFGGESVCNTFGCRCA